MVKHRKGLMVNEENEIVYDDPGSVTDIRKRFGIRTKNDFITPKGYSVQPVSGFTRVKSPTAQINHLPLQEPIKSSTSSTQINRQATYTQNFEKIINEGFADVTSISYNKEPGQPRERPLIGQKPKIPKKPNFQIFQKKQNTDILTKIENLQISQQDLSFEDAVSDFYKHVQMLDPSIRPSSRS